MGYIIHHFGSILRVSVIKDFDTKQPRGFAYILFKNGEANMAIEKMNQTNPFNEWNITVEYAKRGKPSPKKPSINVIIEIKNLFTILVIQIEMIK